MTPPLPARDATRPLRPPAIRATLSAALGALLLVALAVGPTTAAETAMTPACDGVNIRTAASTSSTIKATLPLGASVTVTGTVSGGSWGTSCPTWKSGSSWYVVSHIDGTAVATTYGVVQLYAATGVLVAAPTSTSPGGDGLTVLAESTTFYGRGYGHGVGMSQHGARGRALAGQSSAQILAHYYAGTTIGSISTGTRIRVLILDDFAPTSTAPLVVFGRGGSWTISGNATVFPADARLRLYAPVAGSTAWRAVVDLAGSVLHDGPVPSDVRLDGTTYVTTFHVDSKPSIYDLYRGELRVIASGTTVDVVNELLLETYLRGVLPAEMPSSWPLSARLAQAIAARSYAAAHLRSATATFDVYDDTRSQVYGGVKRESSTFDKVISATAGQVLKSGSTIANALFHSTAGGATEHNENAFVSSSGAKVAGPVSYLRGASDRDPNGVAYDAASPYATWASGAYSVSALSAIFARDSRTNVGTLTALDLRNRGVSGRLISVTLVGSGGSRTVSGAVFMSVFNAGNPAGDPNLRSTLLDVAPIP